MEEELTNLVRTFEALGPLVGTRGVSAMSGAVRCWG